MKKKKPQSNKNKNPKKKKKKKKKKRWKKINYLGYITLDILPYDVHEEGGSWICHLLGIVCF